MSANLSPVLSSDEIKSLEQDIISAAEADGHEAAWQKAQSLRQAQSHQPDAAQALLRIIDEQCVPRQAAVDVLTEISQSHPDNANTMRSVGICLEAARDIDDLNAPPPDEAVFSDVVESLTVFAREHEGLEDEGRILRGLATSARMMARQSDDIAEASYRRLVELNPKKCSDHYNLGLFFKTRGRFDEGMQSNQTAVSLSDEVVDGYEWNLGICATGAGHGEVALDVWKRMGQKIEMGRFGLPEGGYPQCKVKLAERPLAERSAEDDDPGLEETIWIERLSPCHGIIRSVLYQDLGVDYGDVILIDGAPITYHTYGDEQIPVFPHLATLSRRNYQIFRFAGTQDEARQLADTSMDLDADAIVYSHTESYREMCSNCWRDPGLDHERHDTMEKHVVTGRIAAPADVAPAQLLDQIDKAVAKRSPCQIYVPDLCIAAGQDNRASIDKRRFDMLVGN
ncbi:MAG: prenyltransferase [Hyphomicrobiales bacterium]|nr:prenyltransferase [Hyphomicrobiales bacterium]